LHAVRPPWPSGGDMLCFDEPKLKTTMAVGWAERLGPMVN
jgi:hypothetical protein